MKKIKGSVKAYIFILLFTAILFAEYGLTYYIIGNFSAVREIVTEPVLLILLTLIPIFYMMILSIHYTLWKDFKRSFTVVWYISIAIHFILIFVSIYYIINGGGTELCLLVLIFWNTTFCICKRLSMRISGKEGS